MHTATEFLVAKNVGRRRVRSRIARIRYCRTQAGTKYLEENHGVLCQWGLCPFYQHQKSKVRTVTKCSHYYKKSRQTKISIQIKMAKPKIIVICRYVRQQRQNFLQKITEFYSNEGLCSSYWHQESKSDYVSFEEAERFAMKISKHCYRCQ